MLSVMAVASIPWITAYFIFSIEKKGGKSQIVRYTSDNWIGSYWQWITQNLFLCTPSYSYSWKTNCNSMLIISEASLWWGSLYVFLRCLLFWILGLHIGLAHLKDKECLKLWACFMHTLYNWKPLPKWIVTPVHFWCSHNYVMQSHGMILKLVKNSVYLYVHVEERMWVESNLLCPLGFEVG